MYTSTSAPLPQNSQNPPSAADVARYKSEMLNLAQGIDKARTSWMCAYQTAVSSQPWPTQIPGLLPVSTVTVPGQDTTQQRIDAQKRTASALLMPNLTDEQREAIENAPKVLSTPGPCPVIAEEKYCPPNVASPAWGDATVAYPPARCDSFIETAKSNPWAMLLLAGGLVLAVNWLTE